MKKVEEVKDKAEAKEIKMKIKYIIGENTGSGRWTRTTAKQDG
jgi:hypothetical protein